MDALAEYAGLKLSMSSSQNEYPTIAKRTIER